VGCDRVARFRARVVGAYGDRLALALIARAELAQNALEVRRHRDRLERVALVCSMHTGPA